MRESVLFDWLITFSKYNPESPHFLFSKKLGTKPSNQYSKLNISYWNDVSQPHSISIVKLRYCTVPTSLFMVTALVEVWIYVLNCEVVASLAEDRPFWKTYVEWEHFWAGVNVCGDPRSDWGVLHWPSVLVSLKRLREHQIHVESHLCWFLGWSPNTRNEWSTRTYHLETC